ncbi:MULTISPECIES: hypothetical protein [Lysinibacillus]|uniref:hypothetical protein n=1 Tax=Lysinibacillus TaxID=400634 RepID=UPI0023A99355|nr:hypothetical protein [Lysinibacillus fusiformis]WEA41175.1 hypothetical protein PWJ66_09630 [Lysinibacillus fusiformis]
MKIRASLMILGLSSLFFLSGCEEEEEKEEKISATFLQLEKQDDEAYAILADDTNKVYYKMMITSYEYNHWNIEENTLLEDLAVKEKSALSFIGPFPESTTIKKIEINDNWYQIDEFDYFEEEDM